MSLLWTLLLFKLLLTQTSAAVDETTLAALVDNILNVYRPTYTQQFGDPPTFTLAVSVPFNPKTKSYDLIQVTDGDKAEDVRAMLDNCQVYEGRRVMGATVLKWPDVTKQCLEADIPAEWSSVREICDPTVKTWKELNEKCKNVNKKLKKINGGVDHAEYRVLQRFNHLVNRLNTKELNKDDLMLFYSYKSPCSSRCTDRTNKFNILESIKSIKTWPNHVLVFSQIFVPGKTAYNDVELETNRRTSLMNLGNAIGGLGNIHRCVFKSNQCTNCGVQGGVADACVRDVPKYTA